MRASSSACWAARRSGRCSARCPGQLPPRRLGLQPRHLDLAQLQPAHELAALAARDLAVQGDQQVAGRDLLALADVDRGNPAAAGMVDDLDAPGRLDGAGGVDHLVDLRPGEPGQKRQEQGGDAGDQRAGQRRRAAVQELARKRGLALGFGGPLQRHALSPRPAGRPVRAARR